MLSTGHDLTILVHETSITGVEEHIGAVYAMRSEELSSRLGAIIGAYLGSVVAVVIAILQPASPDATPADILLSQIRLTAALAIILVTGALLTFDTNRKIALRRHHVLWAKELATLIRANTV